MNTKLPFAIALLAAAVLAGCGADSEPEDADPPIPQGEQTVELGGTPEALTVADGQVWVADTAGGAIVRLSEDGEESGRPIEVEGGPAFLADTEDSVWVASGTGAITRVDSATGKATPFAEADPQPGGIAADDSFVWVTDPAGDTVAQLDASSGETVAEHAVGDLPTDVAIAGGSAWVANTNDGTVSRIDPDSGDVSEPLAVADQQVLALTADEDGVWVAGTGDERIETVDVSRIDPSDGSLDEESASLESGLPVRLATGEGGVWAMLAGPALSGQGSVVLIDPGTGEPSGEPIAIGAQPRGIASGDGFVWVTDAEGALTRIGARG